MRLKRKDLSVAANSVARFTNPRSPKPAMQCLDLLSEGSKLRIRGYGTYGSASVAIDCDGPIDTTVLAASFCKTVDLLPDDEVTVESRKNKVRISGSSSSIEIPAQSIQWEASNGSPGPKASADAEELIRCLEVANSVGNNLEMSYANGVRICTEGGEMHFSSSTNKNSAFAWCDYAGSDIDVVIARGGIPALTKILQSMKGSVNIEDRDSHVAFFSGEATAVLLKEQAGKPPLKLSKVRSMWKNSHTWRISRTGLSEFVRQAMAVSTPEATGVFLIPTDFGVAARFTGISDGTYAADLSVEATCETYVPGEPCEGEKVYISCRQLAPAVAMMDDEDFVVNAVDNAALILQSKKSLIGLSQLVLPAKEKLCGSGS